MAKLSQESLVLIMKKSSAELKALAKQRLAGHYGILIGGFLLGSGVGILLSLLLEAVFHPNTNASSLSIALYCVCTFIVALLEEVLTVGYTKMALDISRGLEARLDTLFYGFSHQPDRVILLSILVSLIAFACVLPGILITIVCSVIGVSAALPLMLAGILALLAGIVFSVIINYAYGLVFYLYLDHPEKGVLQLMRESRQIMKGNKGRLFYLDISFIGLFLLSSLTCFIGLLWVLPYVEMTKAHFYRNLLGEV